MCLKISIHATNHKKNKHTTNNPQAINTRDKNSNIINISRFFLSHMLENKTRHIRKLTSKIGSSPATDPSALDKNNLSIPLYLLLQNSRQVMNPFFRPCTPNPKNNRRGVYRMCRSHPHRQTQPFYHRFDVWKSKSKT